MHAFIREVVVPSVTIPIEYLQIFCSTTTPPESVQPAAERHEHLRAMSSPRKSTVIDLASSSDESDHLKSQSARTSEFDRSRHNNSQAPSSTASRPAPTLIVKPNRNPKHRKGQASSSRSQQQRPNSLSTSRSLSVSSFSKRRHGLLESHRANCRICLRTTAR